MVETFELALHIILFVFAGLTPALMYFAYKKFSTGEFKRIVKYYLIAFFFSALRWIGGSLVRLDLPFTVTLLYNILWTLAGVLAACFAVYASKLLLDFSRVYGFASPKKAKGKKAS